MKPRDSHLDINLSTLQNISDKQKALAELRNLTVQLSNWSNVKAQHEVTGADVSKQYSSLFERRSQLLKATQKWPNPFPPKGLDLPVRVEWPNYSPSKTLDLPIHTDLLNSFIPWQETPTPNCLDGISEKPNLSLTNGEIATSELGLGGCSYGGHLTNYRHSGDTVWWIKNWHCTIPFLPAKTNGTISYRFVIDTTSNIYRADVLSGSMMSYVTVGTSSDIIKKPIANWADDSRFIIDQQLPLSTFPSINGTALIKGKIRVRKDQRAVIGVIVGVLVGISSGVVDFSWGNFGIRRFLPNNEVIKHTDYGLIEYRFFADSVLDKLKKVEAIQIELMRP